MTRIIRDLPGEYYSLTETARALGMSKRTLRSWIYNNVKGLQPSKRVNYGDTFLWLYTRDDVVRMRRNLDDRASVRNYKRPPRESRYTDTQRLNRSRLMSSRWYWKKALEKAAFFQDKRNHDKAQRRLEEIERELKQIKEEAKR